MNERQQRAAERILEDEGLTGTLTDAQARPLIDWASAQAARVAADPTRSDAEVDAALGALRQALLRVSSTAADAQDAERLVALAQQAFAQLVPDSAPAEHPVAPRPSMWQRLLRRFGKRG